MNEGTLDEHAVSTSFLLSAEPAFNSEKPGTQHKLGPGEIN
jgi:hypothetical protein